MDLIYGSEFSFVNGYAIKPFRTFVVNTNAPLHSSGFEIPPSGGVATFPDSNTYADRFFVWRAIGQKLFIEERSLLFTINDNSLCIDFSRTPILPGTSITISEDAILSIVVPTASSIHRFYTRLVGAKSHDTFSILARIREDELIRRYHSAHVLTTPGRPIRATATHHKHRNTVAYCTAEGQLVVVTLNSIADSNEKNEEIVFGDNGFFKRLLGTPGSRSNLFSDAVVVKNRRKCAQNLRKSNFPGITSDLVYAVTRDGWIQGWNVETNKQLPMTIDLKAFCSYLNGIGEGEAAKYETLYTIKAHPFQSDYLLTIGSEILEDGKCIACCIHLVKATNDKLSHLSIYEKHLNGDERMNDFGLLQLEAPFEGDGDEQMENSGFSSRGDIPQTAVAFSFTVLFKSASIVKKYVLRRVSFSIDWDTSKLFTEFGWHEINQFCSSSANQGERERDSDGEEDEDESSTSKPYNLSAESSIETISDVVFDTDLHSFDVVHRAVQIVTDNFRGPSGQIRYLNWDDLSKLVEKYQTSVEFNRKYQQKTDRSIRLRLNASQETQLIARKAFWWALLRACEELDFAAKGVISLAPMQLDTDLKLMVVVHQDRVTILGDNNFELFTILCRDVRNPSSKLIEVRRGVIPNKQIIDLIEEASKIADNRIAMMNRERARCANARNGISTTDDEIFENGYDYENDGRCLSVNDTFDATIFSLSSSLIENANYDNSLPFGAPNRCVFSGAFTQSLVSANVRVCVERKLHFALTLRALLNGIANQRSKCGAIGFGELDSLKIELREIIRIYRELIEQLDVKIVRNGAKMSLGTWLISDDEGLAKIREEGGKGSEESVQDTADFNAFVGITTEAAVRALLSTSEVLLLFRRLVAAKEFRILLTLLNGYINETRSLKPVINFYRGISYSGTNHPAKALAAFKSALDPFIDGNVALRKAILSMVTRTFDNSNGIEPIDQLGLPEYYLIVVRFLQEHGHTEEVVSVALTAIETLPVESDSVQLISNTLFTHLTTRNEWFRALKLILRTTLDSATRKASICELLTLMLAQGEWEVIATMKYGIHESVVEEFLRDAASRQSPNETKHIYELLFAFYVARKEYRMAACSMYEYAKHIETTNQMTADLLRRRRDALAAVLNMQAVLSIDPEDEEMIYDDHEDTNLVFPVAENEELDDEDESGENDENDGFEIGNRVAENVRIQQNKGERGFGKVLLDVPISSGDFNNGSNNGSDYTTSSSSTGSTEKKLVDLKTRMRDHREYEEELYRQTQELQSVLQRNQGQGQREQENQENSSENQENGGENRMEHDGAWSGSALSQSPKKLLKKRKRVIVLTENQIRDEFVICSARVGLLKSEVYDGIPPTEPTELLKSLTDTWQFDAAFDVAKQFSLDSQQLYYSLAREAIMIDALKDEMTIAMAATQLEGWVRLNRRHSHSVAMSDDHWSVVRGLIEAAHVEWPGDSRPFRGAVEAFLSYRLNVPYWLHNMYESHDANDYLRCLIDFENFVTALQVVIDNVQREAGKISVNGERTCLPIGAIDELLRLVEGCSKNAYNKENDENVRAEILKLTNEAKKELSGYLQKVETFERSKQMSQQFFKH